MVGRRAAKRRVHKTEMKKKNSNNNNNSDNGNGHDNVNGTNPGTDMVDIPDKEYWRTLRKVYLKVKGTTDVEYDRYIRDYLQRYGPCCSLIKFEVKYISPQKGRGVFALQPVKKGRRVWETELCGRFLSRRQFVDFLTSLPTHQMQRDVISWAYVLNEENHDDGQGGETTGVDERLDDGREEEEGTRTRTRTDGRVLRVYLDLDAGSLINHGGTDITDLEGWESTQSPSSSSP